MRLPKLFAPTLAAGIAIAILTGLGIWQLQRLEWKTGLIDRIASRVHAPPVPLGSVLPATAASSDDIEYTHIIATGRFRHDLERYLYATGQTDWGWDVLTPLEMADGRAIVVNRGFVPRAQIDRATRVAGLPAGQVTVLGLVRRAPGARPWSAPLPAPDKYQWYWLELSAITASMYPAESQAITGFYVDCDPIAAPAPPAGGVTNLDLPNRHLEYAFTWFGLAATLAVIYGVFARQQLQGPRGKTAP